MNKNNITVSIKESYTYIFIFDTGQENCQVIRTYLLEISKHIRYLIYINNGAILQKKPTEISSPDMSSYEHIDSQLNILTRQIGKHSDGYIITQRNKNYLKYHLSTSLEKEPKYRDGYMLYFLVQFSWNDFKSDKYTKMIKSFILHKSNEW